FVAKVDADFPVAAGHLGGVRREEAVERPRDVVRESLAVAVKQLIFRLVNKGIPDDHSRVAVPGQDALLAARGLKPVEGDAERHDRKQAAPVVSHRVTEELDAEMSPAFLPEEIHLFGGDAPAVKILVEKDHRSIQWGSPDVVPRQTVRELVVILQLLLQPVKFRPELIQNPGV